MMAVGQNNKDSLMVPPSTLLSTEEEEANNSYVFPVEKKPSGQSWCSSCFGSSGSSSSSSSGSSLSSPVGSELGSTESESDQDDDYVAELTRQMAYYMLQDDDSSKHDQAWNSDGSPQPTIWSSQEDAQVMHKFENLQINGDNLRYQNREGFSPTSILPNARNPSGFTVNFLAKQALINDQIRAIRRLRKSKQDQIIKQKQDSSGYKQMEPTYTRQVRQVESKGRACGSGFNRSNRQKVSWASNNDLQQLQLQRTGSDTMRAGSLGEPGSRSGSCGTGVFFPRASANTSESRKKPARCSTVIVPARVVHALKIHFDKVGVPARSNSVVSLLRIDGTTGDVSYDLQLQEKSRSGTVPATNHHHHPEICLPQEWTY